VLLADGSEFTPVPFSTPNDLSCPNREVTVNAVIPVDADFNADGEVDGGDGLAWQRGHGSPQSVGTQQLKWIQSRKLIKQNVINS
jgi:hypothetical protein